jgi:general secretion pathway protein D
MALTLASLAFVPATVAWAQEGDDKDRAPTGATKPGAPAAKTIRAREAPRRMVPRGEILPVARARPGTSAPPSPPIAAPPAPAGAPLAPPAPAGAATAKPAAEAVSLPGEKEFNECVRIPRGRRVKVTLKPDSDLADLVAWISAMTCKKFIVAASLRAQKVTIVSPTPVTSQEAYRAFLSALEVMGLTVTPAGRFLKVVQGNWAIQSAIPTYTDEERAQVPMDDAVVTQLARVESADANELLLVLNKMKSRSGDVTAFKPTNMLIITDNAYNVRRMLNLIKALDVGTEGEKIWVIRLKNADVEEVNKILQQIFGQKTGAPTVTRVRVAGTGGGGTEEELANLSVSKIVADPLSNSLIIVASPSAFARIASLIRKLDVEAEGSNQKINVYYLENGDAETMANTLAGLTAGVAPRAGGRGAARAAATPRPAGQPGTLATLFEGEVKISPDKPTNSLVIVASAKDFLSLRGVIRKLDIPRRQVFVEAAIMEISMDKSRKLGFAYHGAGAVGEGSSKALLFGGLENGGELNSFSVNPLSLMGLAAGARGQTIDGSGKLLGLSADIPAFGVMFQALQNNSNVNVLSSPHILTTDNEPAEITVGQNLPFQGSFVGGLGGATGQTGISSLLPAISVQRQDVVLKLKITPHVNESEVVRLELDQEVSDISSPNFNNLGPATSKRTVKTMVVVRDQQTVVIGGLMADRINNTETKIPLLGDIPILGYFFKNTSKTMQKTNLLIVLTPYVIRDQSDLRRIFKKKLEERQEYIRRYTSFNAHELSQDVDFRHKRGLLSEIAKVGEQAEQEAKMMEEAKKQRQDKVEGVEIPKELMEHPARPSAPGAGEPSTDAPPPTAVEQDRTPRVEPQIR